MPEALPSWPTERCAPRKPDLQIGALAPAAPSLGKGELMSMDTVHELLTSIWTLSALVVFTGIVFWAWRPRNRKRFERDAGIPLNDKD